MTALQYLNHRGLAIAGPLDAGQWAAVVDMVYTAIDKPLAKALLDIKPAAADSELDFLLKMKAL